MHCRNETISREALSQWLSYDPETGLFRWIKRGYRIRLGYIAGNRGPNGYVRISIMKVFYQAHRLAWLFMTGEWPKEDIDHFNGVRDDNRWANLRSVSRAVNLQNMAGVAGYQLTRNKKRFSARIQTNGATIYIGTFDTAEAAREAYLRAKKKYHLGSRYE